MPEHSRQALPKEKEEAEQWLKPKNSEFLGERGRQQMRIGSRSLGEFLLSVVRIGCERCGRARSYRSDGLDRLGV
jgi:hypothetical protein